MTKDVTRGAGAPLMMMGGRLANLDGQSTLSFGHPTSLEAGHSALVRNGSPSAHGPGL
jgi:hypothetical protein